MYRAILLQYLATDIAAAVTGWLEGFHGAASAKLGGLACALPNLLFALRLTKVTRSAQASYLVNFFLGEFIKIALTVGLLILIVKIYADLHWPSLLIGLVLAVQAGFLAFWKKS